MAQGDLCLCVDVSFCQSLRATTLTDTIATVVSYKGSSDAPTWSLFWPDCCARPGQSTHLITLCLVTPVFVERQSGVSVERQSGVCDTTIAQFYPLIVMVIIDGCPHTHR